MLVPEKSTRINKENQTMKTTKRETTPTLLLQVELENRRLVIHTSLPARWVAIASAVLCGLIFGWDTWLKILDLISRLPR
jgi:hypothetical protein